jgi:CRP-like cAMP-binding protein
MDTKASGPLANLVLASLHRADFDRLEPSLREVSLSQGVILHNPGDELERVLFPHVGMISLLAVMNDGRAIETATVGREGAVGVMAGLGLHTTLERAVVQLPLLASQIAAPAFRKLVHGSLTLRNMVIAQDQVLHLQVQATAACNALHGVDARLCRWILQSHDRNGGGDVVPLTQEFLSEMLGVRRSSVGDVARKLQTVGLVRYSRGVIEIIDRVGLEVAACECYETIRNVAARLVARSR